MGEQGIITPVAGIGTDAGFDAIVGIDRAPLGAAQNGAAQNGVAPAQTAAAPSIVARPVRKHRSAPVLGLLLAGGALLAGGLLVVSGAIPLAPASSADKLAGATTAIQHDSAAAPATSSGTAGFGTAAVVADDVSVLVSAPASYTPSRKALGLDQKETLVFTVTVTNTGTDLASPALAISATSGGTAGTPIIDRLAGLQQPGALPIDGGASRTFRVAFSTASSDATVTVTGSGAGARTVAFGG